MTAHVHKLIRHTAMGIAGAIFEELAVADNRWYGDWKRAYPGLSPAALQLKFAVLKWPAFVGQARHTLAGMLATTCDEAWKDEISRALILDAELGRSKPVRFSPQKTRRG